MKPVFVRLESPTGNNQQTKIERYVIAESAGPNQPEWLRPARLLLLLLVERSGILVAETRQI